MADEISSKLTKLVPFLKKNRTYVKGADLQINIPRVEKTPQLDQAHSFKNVLGQYVGQVNTLQHEADAEIQRLVAGETEDLHEVMLKMDEAETSFQMMMEIRNKLVEAYKDLSKMQG